MRLINIFRSIGALLRPKQKLGLPKQEVVKRHAEIDPVRE